VIESVTKSRFEAGRWRHFLWAR